MEKYNAKQLFKKYQEGEVTPEERLLVEQLFQKDLANSNYKVSDQRIAEANQRTKAHLLQHIEFEQSTVKTVRLLPRIVVAASILLFLSAGLYFFIQKRTLEAQFVHNKTNDIAPGGNKTILTLANGTKIVLNNAGNGILAQQGNNVISKSKTGELVYEQSGRSVTPNEAQVTYNSISIPRGGEYQVLTLPDGTRVWMNSASSLRYPTAFTGAERRVELIGEAYFEVAKAYSSLPIFSSSLRGGSPEQIKRVPFIVESNGQEVEVLGTHFNINAYTDEPGIKTTLLEGSVRVSYLDRGIGARNSNIILKPGQQSILQNHSFVVNEVDTEQAVSWKEGQFMFVDDNIQYIMRIISRWYNVEVVYSGSIPDDSFGGGVSRFKNVSEVLKTLQLTGKVHFKIEDRKITVSK